MALASSTAAAEETATLLLSPTKEEIVKCQFSTWYDTFRNLKQQEQATRRRNNVTIKSVVIRPLPLDFVQYLESDGVRLPLGATKVSSCAPSEMEGEEAAWSSSDDDEEGRGEGEGDSGRGNDDDDGDDIQSLPHQFSFPQLNKQIEQGIEELGGEVVPKLNWSSPKDAIWINNGTLKCQTPGDVYLLLKSSDFVMHDIAYALSDDPSSIEYELVLRKWCNLHPSMEFRCFVYNHELVAISQRQHTQHFPHLARDRVILRSQIIEFYDSVIEERFPLANYVFDVYIDKMERVWLLDFNVWGRQTDALLFTWEEIITMVRSAGKNNDVGESQAPLSSDPEIRVVETEREVHHDPLASYRAPIDTVELAAVAGSDRTKFEEFMALCERPSHVSDDD